MLQAKVPSTKARHSLYAQRKYHRLKARVSLMDSQNNPIPFVLSLLRKMNDDLI